MPAASVTRAIVKKAMQKHGEQKTVRRSGRGNRTVGGPSAVHNAAVSLKAAYSWAFGEELLTENPLIGLKLPEHKSERDRVLTTGEARRVYAAAGRLEYPAQQFVRLLMLTGCRRSEIAGLRWDEIVTADDGSESIELSPGRTKTNTSHHIPLSQGGARCHRRMPAAPHRRLALRVVERRLPTLRQFQPGEGMARRGARRRDRRLAPARFPADDRVAIG